MAMAFEPSLEVVVTACVLLGMWMLLDTREEMETVSRWSWVYLLHASPLPCMLDQGRSPRSLGKLTREEKGTVNVDNVASWAFGCSQLTVKVHFTCFIHLFLTVLNKEILVGRAFHVYLFKVEKGEEERYGERGGEREREKEWFPLLIPSPNRQSGWKPGVWSSSQQSTMGAGTQILHPSSAFPDALAGSLVGYGADGTQISALSVSDLGYGRQ